MSQRPLPANFAGHERPRSASHTTPTLRMGHPNLQTTLRPPRGSPRGKGQGRFPTARFSKIVGLSYG